MVRPREFQEDQVKEAIMTVFWQKGYEATSIQDLVEATGLLKGSLYGAFGDKLTLYLIALEHYDQTRIQAGITMLKMEIPLSEKISRLFDSIIESMNTGVFAGGCLLCNASLEMATLDTSIQKSIEQQINRLCCAVADALSAYINDKSEANELAELIISTYFGARVMAKAGMPTSTVITIRDQCLKNINHIESQIRQT